MLQEDLHHQTEDVIQQSLFTNIPLAKAYPNRALTKDETYLIVAIRYQIQEELKKGYTDLSKPLIFNIDINGLAKERGLKSQVSFRRNIALSVKNLSNNIPTETILYFDKKGKPQAYILPLVMGLNISNNGSVTVKVNPDYQRYYVEHVLKEPDLQIEKNFYLYSRCRYSYPLSNWLVAKIAEARNSGRHQKTYKVIADFSEVQKKVPAHSKTMTTGNYIAKVIRTAVEDINDNEFSSIKILNDDFIHSRKGRKITQLYFDVELSLSDKTPIFIPHPDFKLIDENGIPSWEYIEGCLEKLHVNQSYITKVKKFSREYAYKVYLYTIVRGQDCKYFNRVFENYKGADTIKSLANMLKLSRPELCDDVVESIIMQNTAFEPAFMLEEPEIMPSSNPSPIADQLQALRKRHGTQKLDS